jgi:flagellar M-ring protein FliF
VLGPDRFRTGASVETDFTSAEQQEETFDPTKSVMASSQKSEDLMERGGSAGIPGTASNLPRGNASPTTTAGGGTSRRTEGVTFQNSRVIRHTHIPQGVVKRISLAVLVDQTFHWEGTGAARHRVAEPLKPETIQGLKGLIAAATGLNTDRGDQLILENLPFESSLNPDEPAPASKPTTGPPAPKWLQLWNQYKDMVAPIAIAAGVLIFLMSLVARMLSKHKKPVAVAPDELDRPRELPAELETPSVAHESRRLPNPAADGEADVTERARELAKRDAAVAANIVRLWMQEGKT